MTICTMRNDLMKHKEISSVIWLSIAVCFMLFLYAPLELLLTNQEEFWFDVYLLAPIMLVVFLIMCVSSVLLLLLLKKGNSNRYQIVLMLYFIVFIGLYVQGNFLAAGLPSLDGEPIDWSLYTAERWKSVVVWVAACAVVRCCGCAGYGSFAGNGSGVSGYFHGFYFL